MRQHLPTAADVDPLRAYLAGARPSPASRPWLAVGMISSLDGAATVDGRSGPLGGPADTLVFRAVRAMADVILVGAGTFRAEAYGPVRVAEEAQAVRIEYGLGPGPARLAVVSGSLDLDLAGPAFAGEEPAAAEAPIVFTTVDADPARVGEVAEVAEVRRFGAGRVDVGAAVASLADDGARIVVCEGGPSLNGQLFDAGLVDELCLSVAPVVAGGGACRIVTDSGAGGGVSPTGFELVSLLSEDGLVFGRWVREDHPHRS